MTGLKTQMVRNVVVQKNQKAMIQDYLSKMEQLGVEPNFFISKKYLEFHDVKIVDNKGCLEVWDDEGVLFPAIPFNENKSFMVSFPVQELKEGVLNDYQFFYEPKNFNNLFGNKWLVFRKNTNKFKRLYPNWYYTSEIDFKQLKLLLIEWLENRDTIYDADFLVDCILNPQENYLKGVYVGGQLVGVNFADENYQYINYRWLICKKIPLLDEFCRWCFYTDTEIQEKNKLVNDGGCLDNQGLKKFKEKLNPIMVKILYNF